MVVVRLLLGLSLVCFGWIVQAAALNVEQAEEWRIQLNDQVMFYEEMSGNASAEQIGRLGEGTEGFVPLQQLENPNTRTKGTWWIKVDLVNLGPSDHSLMLIMSPGALFQSVEFFRRNQLGWEPFDRELAESLDLLLTQRFHALPVTLRPGEPTTILIRTTGVAPSQLVPYLYSSNVFNEHLVNSTLWDGLLFGGLLALAWTAWMLGLFSHSRVFALLGFLSISTLCVEALRRGYGDFQTWIGLPEWSYRAPLVVGNLTILIFVLFVLEISRAEQIKMPFRRLLVGWAFYCFGTMWLAAYGDVHLVLWLTEYIRPFLAVTLLIIAIVFIKHNVPTRNVMLAVAAFTFARVCLLVLENTGALPESITNLSMGAVRMNPLFALTSFLVNLTLLAAWVAHVGKQRKAALEQISRLEHEENQRLTEEVARQTSALNKALEYAAEKSRQQTQIVGYISHDLRAPLATISGYTNLIEQSATAKQKPHFDAITRSVDYQMTLIDDILDYATAELKPLSLEPECVEMAPYLDEIAQHAHALSRQQNNSFEFHVPHTIPRAAFIDGRRMRQVLLNLLSNSAKFTRNGTLQLELHAWKLSETWRMRFVCVDSGGGIDSMQQGKVFQKFKQLDPNADGVGLGLYIAQSILKNMGGELTLESAVGVGSRFSFEIEVPAVDDMVISWTAPRSLAEQQLSESKSNTRSALVYSDLADDDSASDLVPLPPVDIRGELAKMTRQGDLTEIEAWLAVMPKRYPESQRYFQLIGDAMSRLDLDAVERLALKTLP